MTSSIQGKVALVTGGSQGIGFATAQKFATEGARVAIASANVARGETAAEKIREVGGEVIFIPTDISDGSQVEALVKRVVDTYGHLNFAFNNAGIVGDTSPIHATSVENFDKVIAVNLKGIWVSMKYEIQHMMQNGGGVIINTSGTAGGRGIQGISAYVASKFGINGITKTAALEYAEAGIRVNSVMPGLVETPPVQSVRERTPGIYDQFIAMTPLKRIADPSEIADAVVWLCSDEASFVTGANFPVDGGALIS